VRQALNNNPIVQIAFLGILALAVAFLLITRVLNQGGESPAEPTTTPAQTPPTAPAAAQSATGDATTPAPANAATAAPPAATDAPPPATEPATEFVPGPGLPAKVVSAYAKGDTVVLLFTRREGIDDDVMRRTLERFDGKDRVSLFDVLARDIADYSRVTQGVEVDRVPALITLSPRSVSGDVPVASVSYGFRGPKSVEQAIRDAGFEGKEIPYFPE
jgi:hypothetical protein